MNVKILGSLLALGLLANSISIYSFASTLPEDSRYETLIDDNITINDILETSTSNIKLEGETLVNNCLNSTKDGVLIENIVRFDSSMIKPNTEYTLIFEVPENNLKEDDVFIIELHSYKESSRAHVYPGQTGKFIQKVVTHDKVNLIPWISGTEIGNVILKNLLVLEGDWTNREIPDYFEGVQSSFEDNLVTQEMVDLGKEKSENLGKYKVEYKVTGKNKIGDELESLGLNADTGEEENDWTRFIRTGFIAVQNTEYTITYNYNNQDNLYALILCYDSNNQFLGVAKGDYGNIINFTPLEGTSYIRVRLTAPNNENADLDLLNYIQLEEGLIATPYEPYKEIINTFYLNSPLLEGDTIEVINNQAYHVKRRKKIVLDGKDEDWLLEAKEFNLRISDKKHSSYVYSDKFRFAQTNYKRYPENNNCILMGSDDYYGVLIRKDEMSTVDEFKQWLSENPVTLVYELAEPIYESIEANVSIQLFKGTTHISNNSNIPTIMEITVDRVANRAKEYSELAKSNPTIENISLARMWTNLMRESILKDEFQDSIDGIIEIADITLERKTVSSNIDIYIKSENTLLMGLNTNSITFEDFSGVEDLEKTNVVNISINSSLPYQLNAYLPAEIQNADKTNIMDKSILNIKESGESTYQAFANTSDKIMLKDNCPAGNYLAHGINIKLKGGIAHEKDVYKTVIKFEAEQK